MLVVGSYSHILPAAPSCSRPGSMFRRTKGEKAGISCVDFVRSLVLFRQVGVRLLVGGVETRFVTCAHSQSAKRRPDIGIAELRAESTI